jgi:Carbohydrate binding domain (family 11)
VTWLLLPSCLVSFKDYPLGALDNAGGDEGGSMPSAGANTGGASTSSGGVQGGGASSGGSPAGTSMGAAAGTAAASGTGGTADGGAAPEALGGASGTGAAGAPPVVPAEPLVDDFEDGDAALPQREGRSGSWYAANDGSFGGMQIPANGADVVPALLSPKRGESARGLHTQGGPFATWGAMIGTAFATSGDEPVPYDLSRYQGLKIWLRASASNPYATKKVRLNLPTTETTEGAGNCTTCDDHFGLDITLTTQWAQIDVPFASLKQRGFGRPTTTKLDLTQALGVELLFGANVSFDLWVDDVELY